MPEVRAAIENHGSVFRSYSKSLVVPLFKYAQLDNTLCIDLLRTNTVDAVITADCDNWLYEYGSDEHDRTAFYVNEETIPIKHLASYDKCTKATLSNLTIVARIPLLVGGGMNC